MAASSSSTSLVSAEHHPTPSQPSGNKPPRPSFFTSAFIQTPFAHHFFKANNNSQPLPPFIPQLHLTSIASNADKFLRQLHSVAMENPFLKKLFSVSSHFRSFSQMRCRDNRSLNSLSQHNFAAVLPGDSVAGIVVANGVLNFLNLYNTILVVRLVLTWFPNTPAAIVSPLSTICDPYLNIFRGIIPPLGGTLDLSPILAFLVLNAFTSAASALPAELPSPGTCRGDSLTTSQKWRKRLSGQRSSNRSDSD